MISRAGTTLLAVGFVLTAFAGWWNSSTPAGGANIGAGVLFILGLVIGCAGLVTAAIGLIVERRRNAVRS